MKSRLLKSSKRFAAILLSAMLIVSTAGCGNKSDTKNTNSTTKNVETTTEAKDTDTTTNSTTDDKTTETTTGTKGKFTPGTYTATVTGMHEMKISVTVSDNEILDIAIDHTETAGVGEPVAESMPNEILKIQGLGVDSVSGATLTSNAIIEGVSDALKQAGCTDADIEALKAIHGEEAVKESDDEITADVIVIGAGGAGMAAAITANQAGKKVIVIEKTSQMGGNTILSGGALNAVDDGSETAKANKDSVAHHYEQTFEGGDKQGDPKLVHVLTDNAWSGVEWLKSLGMEFCDGVFTVTGGLWPRAHKPVMPGGTGFFKAYQGYVDGNDDLTIMYNTKADELLVENGTVVGVACTGETGNKLTFKATNGIVLATGGFSRNVELRQKANEVNKQWPTLDESIPSTNASGITGDGIKMADSIGANLIQLENIQLLPLGDPETGSLSGNIEHAVESRIFVNEDGNRFVNEAGRRDDMTLGLFAQKDATMFIIMDSDTYPKGDELNNFGEKISDLVAAGRAYKADTLEDLAKQIGVSAENLVASVDNYNRYCKGGDLEGKADEFGRELFVDTDGQNNGINNGPFYACKRVPTVHHTMGGVQINDKAQVLDKNGNVIPGLMAAGEVTGGIHGTNRLGGNALTDTVVFGRIAGQSAVEFTR